MFQALKEYAERKELIVSPGFASKDIRWALDCSPEGRFLAVIPLGDGKHGEIFPACPYMTDSQLKTGGEIRSQVLWESAKVVLDWADIDRKDRDEKKHSFFLKMLKEAGSDSLAISAGSMMLHRKSEKERAIKALENVRAKPTDKVTLAMSGDIPLRKSEWHGWWLGWFKKHCIVEQGSAVKDGMICLMTGELVSPAMTHDKVTKLPDTGSFGGVLAAFDKDAFTSFGLEQGQNAAMSGAMASLYPKALDHLLINSSRQLGPIRAVIWFKKATPEADATLDWLFDGSDDDESLGKSAHIKVRQFLDALKDGKRASLGLNEYYCLLLSGSPSRVVVRFWETGRLEQLAQAINGWVSDLKICRRDGQGEAPDPKFFAVVGSTKGEEEEFLAHVVIQLWNCAVLNRNIPRELMAKSLRRFKSQVMKDETILHAGIGLLKAFHLRGGDKQMQIHLNPDHPAAEYQCGRLLAVLSALQYSALGDVGAGVVQRFYGAASQTPKTVMGSLIRNSNHHLAKLDGGLRYWYQNKIAEIMARLGDGLPKTLTLEQQSLFALGFYQQMAFDRSKPENKNQQNQEVSK